MKMRDISPPARWKPELRQTKAGVWNTTGTDSSGNAWGYRNKQDYTGVEVIQTPDGPYVRYDDYDSLLQKYKALQQKLARASRHIATLRSTSDKV